MGQIHTPQNTPPTSDDEAPVNMVFEDENGRDNANALSEALRHLSNFAFEQDDLGFYFNQIETKMAAAGVKKNFTKLQVLSSIIPPHVTKEVKSVLRKGEEEFGENMPYKVLKREIISIFGKKGHKNVEEALNLVITDRPSTLARELVDKLCKHELDCECCPDIIFCLWKKQLSTTVKAGIAKEKFNKDNFKNIIALADSIHEDSNPSSGASVAAVGLDETQPAIPYPQQEVAAMSRGRGGRGGRGRGGRGGRNQNGNQNQNNGNGGGSGSGRNQSNQNQGGGSSRGRGPRHPDMPPEQACKLHWKFGKSAHFCVDPATCPWKDIFTPKSRSNQ